MSGSSKKKPVKAPEPEEAGAQKTAFVIMPFTGRDPYEADHWEEVYEGFIEKGAYGAGLRCIRADTENVSRQIVNDLLRKIESADLVICDLSSRNPNVFLELGWALRANRPNILLSDERTTTPFDIGQLDVSRYDHRLRPKALDQAIEQLTKKIRGTLADKGKRWSLLHGTAIRTSMEENVDDPVSQGVAEVLRRLDDIVPQEPRVITVTKTTNVTHFYDALVRYLFWRPDRPIRRFRADEYIVEVRPHHVVLLSKKRESATWTPEDPTEQWLPGAENLLESVGSFREAKAALASVLGPPNGQRDEAATVAGPRT